MRPLTLSDVKRAAAKFGGTVKREQQGRSIVIEVFAPPNKLWSADGIHSFLVERSEFDTSVEYQEAYAALIRRISYGVDDCDDPECEYCHPPAEEDIGSAIDRFASLSKQAGIIKTPPELTKTLVSWAKSVYCSKVLTTINDQINISQYRNEMAKHLADLAESEDYQALREAAQNQDFKTILPKQGETFQVRIGRFSKAVDKDTDFEGTYDATGSPDLWITIYAHTGFRGFYNARVKIFSDDTGLVKELREDKLIEMLNDSAWLIRDEMSRFDDFRYAYQTADNNHIKRLTQTRVECLRHIKPNFTNPQTFPLPTIPELEDLGYIKPTEPAFAGRKSKQAFTAEFIFTDTKEGRKKANLLSQEGWRGLYIPSSMIFIARDAPNNPYAQGLVSDLSDIERTAIHELRHMMQTRITQTKRLDYADEPEIQINQTLNLSGEPKKPTNNPISGKPLGSTKKRHQRWLTKRKDREAYLAGLPGRSLREQRHDPYGHTFNNPRIGPRAPRQEHSLRDIEFFTDLGDKIAEFKETVSQVPRKLHRAFFHTFTGQSTPSEFNRHSHDVLHQEMGMRWGIDMEALQPWTMRTLREGHYFFDLLKRTNEPKYRKAVNEFYKEVVGLL